MKREIAYLSAGVICLVAAAIFFVTALTLPNESTREGSAFGISRSVGRFILPFIVMTLGLWLIKRANLARQSQLSEMMLGGATSAKQTNILKRRFSYRIWAIGTMAAFAVLAAIPLSLGGSTVDNTSFWSDLWNVFFGEGDRENLWTAVTVNGIVYFFLAAIVGLIVQRIFQDRALRLDSSTTTVKESDGVPRTVPLPPHEL